MHGHTHSRERGNLIMMFENQRKRNDRQNGHSDDSNKLNKTYKRTFKKDWKKSMPGGCKKVQLSSQNSALSEEIVEADSMH